MGNRKLRVEILKPVQHDRKEPDKRNKREKRNKRNRPNRRNQRD